MTGMFETFDSRRLLVGVEGDRVVLVDTDANTEVWMSGPEARAVAMKLIIQSVLADKEET